MASVLVRPRWLLLHLCFVVALGVMLAAGFWQLDRLADRQDRNEQVRDRGEQPVVPVEQLVAADIDDGAVDELRYRPVVASGRYLVDDQVLVRSRSRQGAPGLWVLTPVTLADGRAVVVNRGWIPAAQRTDGADVDFPTPQGAVEVRGLVELGGSDPRPAGDRQTTVARPDLGWYDEQTGVELLPVLVQLQSQQPAQSTELPMALDPPPLDEGPHFSYAVQWFLFAAVAVVGYPVLLRTIARRAPTPDGDR
jgi:surfeit locus 1 family protein